MSELICQGRSRQEILRTPISVRLVFFRVQISNKKVYYVTADRNSLLGGRPSSAYPCSSL